MDGYRASCPTVRVSSQPCNLKLDGDVRPASARPHMHGISIDSASHGWVAGCFGNSTASWSATAKRSCSSGKHAGTQEGCECKTLGWYVL
ncbi:hypothetical protein BRADI_3g41475v3 [Brachypodium distachyon]|uniref:Uncharacterized protein n=1 Tax=Brachypodium distachyon TaxID=15368 RepID=A0A2K2D2J4_BRADI|nr:hypothetical protein BRADI_3g41475v3 [Brachypodium distachyon]